MKKWIALLMAALMISTIVCAYAEPVVGGWSIAEDTSINDERLAVFNKALSGYVGVNYWPVAYLGSQVVAGTNHCFLCTASPVVPNPGIHYVLVYIYEDLEGNAEYLDRDTISVPGEMDFVPEEPEDGGWGFVMDHTITEAHKALVAKATETLLGAKYEPVVYLSMQVVGGFNHCFLCKVTPVVPDAQAHFVIVELYDDAEGNAEIRSIDDVELGLAFSEE